nr:MULTISPECIES: acyltransferase [Protofrankia]
MRGINVPSWSLSVELIFYLSFPLLYFGITRVRPERLWWLFGGLALGTLAIGVIAHTALPGQPRLPLPGMHMSLWQNWLVYPFPPSRLLEFSIGIVTARIVLTGRWIRLSLPVAGLLLAATLTLQLLIPVTALTTVAPTVAPTALVIAAAATADRSGRGTIFANRVWTWLGEVSFALYIVHYPTLYFLQESIGFGSGHSATTSFPISALLLLPALVASWLLYSLVERPLVGRWSNPRSARPDKMPAQRQNPDAATAETVAEKRSEDTPHVIPEYRGT